MKATIKGIELKKAKSGARGIIICVVTDDNQWLREWIGESAPADVSNRWWLSTGNTSLGWNGLASTDAFELIDSEVTVKIKPDGYNGKPEIEGVYGPDASIESGVESPGAMVENIQLAEDDEIPF